MNFAQDSQTQENAFDTTKLCNSVDDQPTKSESKLSKSLLGKRQRDDLCKDFSKNKNSTGIYFD